MTASERKGSLTDESHVALNDKRKHAIVVGGSVAGLLATRVLSDHFETVSLIEKDEVHDRPETRKSQPQTRHVHGLLTSGFGVLQNLFPGLREELEDGGALIRDLAADVMFHIGGDYAVRHDSGMPVVFSSRPFLEWKIRQRVLGLPNVTLCDETRVTGLSSETGRITGVETEPVSDTTHGRKRISADLVVDATGRGSPLSKWLEGLSYEKPTETLVQINLTYTTRIYRRTKADSPRATAYLCNPNLPQYRRIAVFFPLEEDRWILTLGGWNGDNCPPDDALMHEWIAGLQAREIDEIASKLEPISEPYRYKFAANLRRHYEKLRSFPDGLLVLGDAVASFNPVYGQGMSSAALQAQQLKEILENTDGLDGIWRPNFKRIAPVIDTAWQLAVGADFGFEGTKGRKPAGTDFINRYIRRVFRACHHDPVVHNAFMRVQNMLAPPPSLFHPRIVWRVLRGGG